MMGLTRLVYTVALVVEMHGLFLKFTWHNC